MKKWHKWVGLFSSFFLILFALSGIFLNHRKALTGIDLPRSWLPEGYRYHNWNNGAVKGSLLLSPDSVLLFGGCGILLSDSLHREITVFEDGLSKGADSRSVGNIVKTESGEVYAMTTFDLYRLNRKTKQWEKRSERIGTEERFSDLQAKGDSLVLLARSHLFVAEYPFERFDKAELHEPAGYKKEMSLFRMMWTLHSGELFGIPGKLFVDLLGIVVIILCVTGMILSFFPQIIKRRRGREKPVRNHTGLWMASLKWHNRLGAILFVFLLLLVLSGTFLRPPLLIAIIRGKMNTLPGTSLHSDNPWFDKLRCLRYDRSGDEWILYTSDGFFRMKSFDATPEKIERTPPVSVMGVTVLEPRDSSSWLVGSFSGLYYWNKKTGQTVDAYTFKPARIRRGGPPTFTNAVAGYSADFRDGEIVFDYSRGAKVLHSDRLFAPMPDNLIRNSRMSLWHVSLEVHVGRIYSPVIGIFSDLFVFLSGTFFLSILISGYVIYRRHFRKRPIKKYS